MQVTITVDLDDDTSVTRIIEVDSSDNPRYWSQGFDTGVENSQTAIRTMLESVYGTADRKGIHIIR